MWTILPLLNVQNTVWDGCYTITLSQLFIFRECFFFNCSSLFSFFPIIKFVHYFWMFINKLLFICEQKHCICSCCTQAFHCDLCKWHYIYCLHLWHLHLYFIVRSYKGISCLYSCAVTQIVNCLHTIAVLNMVLHGSHFQVMWLMSPFLSPFFFLLHLGCCSS